MDEVRRDAITLLNLSNSGLGPTEGMCHSARGHSRSPHGAVPCCGMDLLFGVYYLLPAVIKVVPPISSHRAVMDEVLPSYPGYVVGKLLATSAAITSLNLRVNELGVCGATGVSIGSPCVLKRKASGVSGPQGSVYSDGLMHVESSTNRTG